MASAKLGETSAGQCFMIDSCQDSPAGYVLKHFSDDKGSFVSFRNFC